MMPTVESKTIVPFVDLKAQYQSIKQEIDAAIAEGDRGDGLYRRLIREGIRRGLRPLLRRGALRGRSERHRCAVHRFEDARSRSGGRVITVANSFIATSEAIAMAGAQVVFVDIDPQDLQHRVESIEEKITAKTKAIIPVHLYGQPADMDPIRSLANKHGLYVIGDAAQAHGAQYRGRPISTLADITCFSFYPGKNLGAYGDAGALVTDNDDWAARARMFANHGRAKKYDHDFEGVNSRLDGLQAAILSVKLRHLDQWTNSRRRIAYRYNDALKSLKVVVPHELDDVRAVYHLYVVRVPGGKRDTLQEHLKACGISTGIHYPIALPHLNAYSHLGHSEGEFPESLKASGEILSLPMFLGAHGRAGGLRGRKHRER